MHIGLDTFSYQLVLAAGRYNVFDVLDSLESMGVSGLQININGPNGRFLSGAPSDDTHVQRVRQAFEQRGLFIEVAGRSTLPDMLDWQLRLTAALGAKIFRTVLAFDSSIENTFARRRVHLLASLPLAHELDVCIALENHEDITASELRAFVTGMDDPNLGVCLDTGNDLVLHGDPLKGAELLAPLARTTHIKDQRLVRVDGEVYSIGDPLGTGDIDLPAIFAVIAAKSSLERIMIQDTTGYATPLNPFNRPDIAPHQSCDNLPEYDSKDDAYVDGLLFSPKDLSQENLHEQATLQLQRIEQDVAYVRTLT